MSATLTLMPDRQQLLKRQDQLIRRLVGPHVGTPLAAAIANLACPALRGRTSWRPVRPTACSTRSGRNLRPGQVFEIEIFRGSPVREADFIASAVGADFVFDDPDLHRVPRAAIIKELKHSGGSFWQ